MKPTQPEILAYVLKTVQDLCQDWDYADPVGPESLLFTGLGMESLDAVVLCTAIQEHYQTTMPFAELLADIGQKQRDLSIAELAEFAGQHVSTVAQAAQAGGQEAVEAGSPRSA
jgi:acyl carrier protein